jgi:hypothetical protein
VSLFQGAAGTAKPSNSLPVYSPVNRKNCEIKTIAV